jgi:hypothetical protein
VQKTTSVTLIDRFIGAARLDPRAYDAIKADAGATLQAVFVVVLAGLATGIGVSVSEESARSEIFRYLAEGVIAWGIWATTSHFVGTALLRSYAAPAPAGWRELARTAGFAHSPVVLRVLMVLPYAAFPVFAVTMFWQLAAMTVAVRQTLAYESLWRALAVALSGFVVSTATLLVVNSLLRPQ